MSGLIPDSFIEELLARSDVVCGAHGTVIGFLMQYEGLEFLDAVEELARAAGLEVPKSGGQKPRPDTGLYDMLASCSKFYVEQLKKHPNAVEYLKGRGLSGEVSRDFEIGYAPAGWDALIKHLGTDESHHVPHP